MLEEVGGTERDKHGGVSEHGDEAAGSAGWWGWAAGAQKADDVVKFPR